MSVNSAREEILAEVRRALHGDGKISPVPSATPTSTSTQLEDVVSQIRDKCERQRDALSDRFESESIRIGVRFYRAASAEAVFQHIKDVCKALAAKRIVGWQTPLIAEVDLRKRLEERGVEFLTETAEREFIAKAESADIGISGVDYALADTGTLVLLAGKGRARSISLLPPVHIAIVSSRQILSGLSDLFPVVRAEAPSGELSSAITFITGPSRTADIELTLVVGVHGPQQLHVLLL